MKLNGTIALISLMLLTSMSSNAKAIKTLETLEGLKAMQFLISPNSYISKLTKKPYMYAKNTVNGTRGVECYLPGFHYFAKEISDATNIDIYQNHKNIKQLNTFNATVKIHSPIKAVCQNYTDDPKWCDEFGPKDGDFDYPISAVLRMNGITIKTDNLFCALRENLNISNESEGAF